MMLLELLQEWWCLGDPKSRSQDLIKEDLKNELITPEVAREVYGMMDA